MQNENRKIKNVETKEITYEQVKNTPFTIIKHEKKYIIVIGDTAVTNKKFKTKIGAYIHIKLKPWELLGNTICIIAKKINEYEKNN